MHEVYILWVVKDLPNLYEHAMFCSQMLVFMLKSDNMKKQNK